LEFNKKTSWGNYHSSKVSLRENYQGLFLAQGF